MSHAYKDVEMDAVNSAAIRKHKWPVTVLVFETDAMVPKYTTMNQSPLSYEPDMKRSRLSVTASAMGLAWLAFRPEDEQEIVISTLARSRRKSEFLARDKPKLRGMLERVRKDGYATSLFDPGPAMGVAVPVLNGGLANAAVLMRCYRNAMPLDQAIERYLPDLLETASAIADVRASGLPLKLWR
jgi:IclR family mhp operon transcriptional activator